MLICICVCLSFSWDFFVDWIESNAGAFACIRVCFQVSVQLLDEHGNPIPHSHTITLSARKETEETEETEAETKGTEETDPETEEASQQIEFLGAAEATAAETQTSSGIATFKEIALPPSKDILYLKVLLLSLLFLSPLLLSLLLLLFEGPLLNGSTVYLLQTT